MILRLMHSFVSVAWATRLADNWTTDNKETSPTCLAASLVTFFSILQSVIDQLVYPYYSLFRLNLLAFLTWALRQSWVAFSFLQFWSSIEITPIIRARITPPKKITANQLLQKQRPKTKIQRIEFVVIIVSFLWRIADYYFYLRCKDRRSL